MALTPIRPRRPVVDAAKHQAAATTFLKGFSSDFVREMAAYPSAQPWRSRPPRRGPRAGGRRTGTLGRGWSARIRFTPDSVTIENPTPYGIYAEGPRPGQPRRRQTANMAARGWPSISTVSPKVLKKHQAILRKALR